MVPAVSAIVPALNEGTTIAEVVHRLRENRSVKEVIVVDNGSEDRTAREASAAGARVLPCPRRGKGHALTTGLRAASLNWCLAIDADITGVSGSWVNQMVRLAGDDVGLVKGTWTSRDDPLPVTNLVVRPALRVLYPSLQYLTSPISGIFLCDRRNLNLDSYAPDYAIDIEIVLACAARGKRIVETPLGEIGHARRDVNHHPEMSFQILRYLIDRSKIRCTDRVLILCDSPLDAFASCGGTIIKYLNHGAPVLTVHCDTQGPPAVPLTELYPNCRSMFIGRHNEDVLIATMREFEPGVLIQPTRSRPNRTTDGEFLGTLGQGRPERAYRMSPRGWCAPTKLFEPDIYVDVTEEWPAKMTLLGALMAPEAISQTDETGSVSGMLSRVSRSEPFESSALPGYPRARDAL